MRTADGEVSPAEPAISAASPTAGLCVPDVLAGGRWWSRDEVEALACGWRDAILDQPGADGRHVAAVVPASVEGVAIVLAVTSLPFSVTVLAPDERAWHSDPPLPAGTLVALPPSAARLARHAEALGYASCLLEARPRQRKGSPITVLQTPGIVLFTSGSTGTPRAVYRSSRALLASAAVRLGPLGLGPGDGMVMGVSLAHGHGLTRLAASLILGGPLALLDPIDYRAALSTLALPEFGCWSATAHFADVLGRCALDGPALVPRVCLLSSPISRGVFDAFSRRFGVPLRQSYSSSETGIIAVDTAPADRVGPETVGRPLAGVEIRVGDDPAAPLPAGTVGRIWVRSPWQMDGYGFPPAVTRPGEVDGWWPTRDVGAFDAEGRLRLAGRLDDCIRTREGRLVNLFAVASRLRELRGVRAAEVVRIDGAAGPSFGAVLECDPGITRASLQTQLSDTLPPWSWPRRLALVSSLPRLTNGKPDRGACLAALARS